MSENIEEQKFGKESIEQSQDFQKMPMAIPDEPPAEDLDSKDILDARYTGVSPREAAAEVVRRRAGGEESEITPVQSPPPPIPRTYIHAGGEHAGEPRPQHETIEIDRASRDLSGTRAAEAAAKEAAADRDLQQAIDALRSGQPEPQEQPQSYQQPAAEQPQQPAGSKAWEDPEVIAGINQYTTETNRALQQAQQQYQAAVQQNALAALAGLTAQFPELQGLNSQQELQTAIQTVSRTNPDRARQITDYIGRVSGLVTESLRVQQAQQDAYTQQLQQYQAATQQQFQRDAKAADDQFDDYARSQGLSDQYVANEIRQEVKNMWRDYGVSDEQLSQLWHGDPIFRSLPAQKLMLDAARFRLAQRGAKAARANPVKTVMRPGSPAERASPENYNARQLSDKLDRSTGRDALRAAAALVSARRAGR